MASRSYSVRALVLRRTKLGESDVICTLLSCDGSQIRAVAKGARKPSSSFASRLEVYSVCDLLLCQGKTLDIVKEARLLEGNEHLRRDYALMEAASPMVEILDKTTQVGLEDERLFPMTCVALKALKAANLENAVASPECYTAGYLLKTLAVLGFRPRFDTCVECGNSISPERLPPRAPFSLVDGGMVCPSCSYASETITLSRDTVLWAQALLFSTFEEISHFEVEVDERLRVMRFLQLWIRQHLGISLKSLDYLISPR